MSDLLDLLDEATEPDRRRAGDFSWTRDYTTRGPGVRTCCLWCRREARWDHIKNWCSGTWQPRPAGPCMAQHTLGNHVRYYAHGLRDRDPRVTDPSATGKRPFDEDRCRQMLATAIDKARAAQVDVDAILTEIGATP